MSTQQHQLAASHIFTIPLADLAAFATYATIADAYPLTTETVGIMDEQRVIYLDTADYRLLRTGLAVCVEQDHEQRLLTVANLAVGLTGDVDKQISRRKPLTATIGSDEVATTIKAWPKALRKAVAPVLSSHAKLHPILLIQRQRTVRTITASPNSKSALAALPLATLTLDHLTVWPPTQEALHDRTPAAAHPITTLGQLTITFISDAVLDDEVTEATMPDTTAAAQATITTWLANQPGYVAVASGHQLLLPAALTAASHHALDGLDETGIQPQMSIVDGCRLIWREQLMTMILQEAGVRYSQEREYVHEMRIAIRRARAAAKLYGHFWPRKTIRPYLAALRKTGRLLGYIRNLDVALTKARRTRDQHGEKVRAPKKLLKAWRQQRQAAQQKLLHWLDSSDYNDFVAEFQHFCTAAEVQSQSQRTMPTPQQVRHVIPAQIWTGYASVRCYEALFEAALPVDYAALHNLRIACKYLRYNLEFVRHLLGAESEPLITRLKGLQELLGDLNDAVVAQTLIDEAREEHEIAPYKEAQAQRMAELSRQVPAALAALVDPESRSQLAIALARL